MDWNRLEGNWRQFKGKIQSKWGKLTDDDIDTIAGKKEQLLGKLQERYGRKRDELERELDMWIQGIDSSDPDHDRPSAP